MSLNQDSRSWFPSSLPAPSSSNIVGLELPYFIPYSMDDYRTALGAVARTWTGTGAVYYNIHPDQTPYVYWNGHYNCYAYPGYMIYYPTVDVDDGTTDAVMEDQDGNGINSSVQEEEDGCELGHLRGGGGGGGEKGGNYNCRKMRREQIWTPRKALESSNTTVMIKNLPKKYRRDSFIKFLDKCCLEHQMEYDFFYLPMKFKTKENRGYAFVNCTNEYAAEKMKEFFQGYKWGTYQTQFGTYVSNRISDSAWAKIQGKDELVRHFSKIIFNCRNCEYLPVLISPPRNGTNATIDASSLTVIGELNKEYSNH